MKIHKFNVISYFLVLISIFVSVSRANAMAQYTVVGDGVYSPPQAATPYPTLTPIANTPTPLLYDGGLNFDCPVGVPSGFGTVTPSIDWLYACAHCLPTYTPVPFETSTLGPTRTPLGTPHQAICVTVPVGGEECYTLTPNATPSVTVTTTSAPTVTPTSAPLLNLLSKGANNTGSPYVSISSSTLICSPDVGNPSNLYNCSATVSGNDANGVIGGYVTANFQFDPLVSSGNQTIYYSYIISPVQGDLLPYFNTVSVTENNYSGSGSISVAYNSNPSFSVGVWSSQARSGVINFDITLMISTDPFSPTPTPTPTSTMVGSNFCDQISDSNIDNLFDFDGTGTIVHQTCFTTAAISFQELFATILTNLFGFIFPSFHDFVVDWLSTVFPIEAVIDPITVCVRERDYSLYLFGYRMPIEFIFAFAIFLAGLRYFVPSMFSGASVIGSGVHSHKQEHHAKSNKVSKDKKEK